MTITVKIERLKDSQPENSLFITQVDRDGHGNLTTLPYGVCELAPGDSEEFNVWNMHDLRVYEAKAKE